MSDSLDYFFAIFILIGPILPSAVATAISYVAYRYSKYGLYLTLNISGILTLLLSLAIYLSLFLGEAGRDAQAGLVLVFWPIWAPFFFVGIFAITWVIYVFGRKDTPERQATQQTARPTLRIFKISLISIGVFVIIMLGLILTNRT